LVTRPVTGSPAAAAGSPTFGRAPTFGHFKFLTHFFTYRHKTWYAISGVHS
jgi:hypothetical protein